ncbi:ATP-dependent helicase [Haloarcula onubensis]|uniref:DNA 3'-5' helicase n=1 Tax=Haloarcula onubensis TaxID=2950539 RepID=A0ABU2FUN2_9EURY|nr:ATP-dependent DNA helicase [Halomicroarcula sp. S3CR25-11]MDS0284465.1 ATP-dependent helicase [Halomicroarcula sp. S3CR25-11]
MTDSEDSLPAWLPTIEEDVDPKDQQKKIIRSGEYPMRVLAGAGTGKTFTMVRKIEHLIDEEGVSPDRILALTFTNNAADSMQEKLQEKLGTAGYDIDAYTYHSICNAILQDYAYTAGIDPEFDVATDAEKYAVALDVLDEIEYRSVKPNVYGPNSHGSGAADALTGFISSMKRSGIDPDAIGAYLGSADRLYELAAIPATIEDAASDNLGGRSVSTVLDGLPAVREALRDAREDVGDHGVEASISVFLDGAIAVCGSLTAAFEAAESGERALPENAHKIPKYLFGGYASGAPKGIPDVGLELPEYLADFLDDCLQARDLVAGYAAYEQELADRGLLDYDDLVVETVKLLETDAVDDIAGRWDYVFCDEFQDTDRLQFDLVTSLVTDENLFVVGDDDQAIYEWRGANVANITDELDNEFGDALADEPLEQNFRSRQPILDLANAALDELDDRKSDKTLTRVDEPDYDGDSVVTVEEAEGDADRADQLVTVVQNLLSGAANELDRAYDPGDIALLVRKHKHAEPLVERFEDLGIPYEVAGDLATDSVGVGTVVAFLKALARPAEDEVSWNRVLTMRYRLCDADLHHLNTRDETLLTALREAPLSEFDEPDRVEAARTHVSHLLELRDSASLARLYREMKDVTDIEWYLSEQDRRSLDQLEDVIEQFGDDAVQPSLTGAFVAALRHHDEVFAENGGTPTDQPELADDAVNVMTIHKSKGLDFPVVLMPRLTADEWGPRGRSYDALEASLTDGPDAAFAQDFVANDARETRRVLHVGLTRAEDVLVLHGSSEDEGASDESMEDLLRETLTPELPWEPDADNLPIWQDIQGCLPPEATDWTESLADTVVGELGGTVTHNGATISPGTAREEVLTLGDNLAAGTVDPTAPSRLAIESLTGPPDVAPEIRHSYTALKTFDECPRQHYLDYVVNAFRDYTPSDEAWTENDTGPSQQTVGILFHDTAEIAADEHASSPSDWYDICERLANQKRARDALPEAKKCIDRYFALELSEWDVVDAEREFAMDIDGEEIVGYIDAVYRTPDDDLVVIDYKATQRERDIEGNRQLPLYLLACRDLYDEPIHSAGYAYVGPLGPKTETKTFSESELQGVEQEIEGVLSTISDLSYDEFVADTHCQWCTHNELPCASSVSKVE